MCLFRWHLQILLEELLSEWFQRGTVGLHRCRMSGRYARPLTWGPTSFSPVFTLQTLDNSEAFVSCGWWSLTREVHLTWKLHLKSVWTLINLESKKLNSLARKFLKSTFVCTWIKVALFLLRLQQPYFFLFGIQCTHIHSLFSVYIVRVIVVARFSFIH